MTTKKPREQLNSELLPCPFCGGKAEIRNETIMDPPFNYQRVYVSCLECGASTDRKISDGYYGQHCSDEEIAALWNRRIMKKYTENEKSRRDFNKEHISTDIFGELFGHLYGARKK